MLLGVTQLQDEGFDVEYHRLPITDGQAPKSRDFDALAGNISRADPSSAFVFNCQVGGRAGVRGEGGGEEIQQERDAGREEVQKQGGRVDRRQRARQRGQCEAARERHDVEWSQSGTPRPMDCDVRSVISHA